MAHMSKITILFLFIYQLALLKTPDDLKSFEPYLVLEEGIRKFYSSSEVTPNQLIGVDQRLTQLKNRILSRSNGKCEFGVFKSWTKVKKLLTHKLRVIFNPRILGTV